MTSTLRAAIVLVPVLMAGAAACDSGSRITGFSGVGSIRSILLSPARDSVIQGDTLRLRVVAATSSGEITDPLLFDWRSSNSNVAAVDRLGLVQGIAPGTVRITAAREQVTGEATITVRSGIFLPAAGER